MSKYCPFCGEELVDTARFCKNCGKNVDVVVENDADKSWDFEVPTVEKSYTAAKVIGYICAVLIPLIGVIVAIYLLTRDSPDAKKHGKYMLIVAAVVWLLSVISIFR